MVSKWRRVRRTCAHLLQFVRDYVKVDGVFVLKMLNAHSSILVCTELVDCM